MMAATTFTVSVLLVCSCFLGNSAALNERPIIGIVSEKLGEGNGSYIAASYVKFLESAGSRVVPILNSTEDQLKHLFNSINGVLFPGGGVSLERSGYSNVGRLMYQWAMEANDAGDYFPLWGTCLGFQLLSVIQSNDPSVLTAVDAENYSIPLVLTPYAKGSRLFSLYTTDAMEWITSENLTMNNHHWAVTAKTFQSISKLNTFFTILSTNMDRNGIEFVSTMEGNKYPFYAVQWHPEKNGFEWTTKEGINHSEHAISIMQMAANFLVQEARKSNHRFASELEERNTLIYNYSPAYTAGAFEQMYLF